MTILVSITILTTEDYDLLAEFFQMAHATGEITVDQLQDIEVN